MSDTIIRVENLGKKNILQGISFSMLEGELVAIMGPSGSGKSTLLYNVSGMDTPEVGRVYLKDTEVTALVEDEKARLRLTRMGFVFQQMNVLSNLNIMDNILLPAYHADRSREARAKAVRKAENLLEILHIRDLKDRKVTEVSGGQLQRACICRSMMLEPEIIFADEPTGALNQTASGEVMEAFLKLNQAGTSILMVTHDSKIASKCERILYLLDGEIRGELALGKFSSIDAQESRMREKRTEEWLKELGW